MQSKVKTENQMQIKKEISADSLFATSETLCIPDLLNIESDSEDVGMIENRGNKNILIFQNIAVQVVEDIPDDIDGIYIYELPQKADLSICKGKKNYGVKWKAVNIQFLLKVQDLPWTAVEVSSVLRRTVKISQILE